MKPFKARVASIRCLTPTLRELSLDLDEAGQFRFRSGQFIVIQIPDGGKKVPRAYSVASSTQDHRHLKLLLKLVEGGMASEYLRRLPIGAEIEFTGPFGHCLFEEPPTEQVVFLCTGAGLAQHMSFLMSDAPRFPETRYRLLLGVWNDSEVFYEAELDELKARLKDFSFEYVVDQASSQWKGKTGYVTDHLEQFNYRRVPTTFYLCGNPAMIQGAKRILIDAHGLAPDQVKEEAFH